MPMVMGNLYHVASKEAIQDFWALDIDFDRPSARYWFWYVSREKLEPRIGVRAEEQGADREMPLGVARETMPGSTWAWCIRFLCLCVFRWKLCHQRII